MADLIGQHLGQYEIVALLGEGGMATVYRARQVSIGRDVAIKIIESKLARNPEFVRRFEREARTVAQLSQIHILKVFDYGQQDDLIYLVMELLAGGSLEDLIRLGALTVDRAARLLEQVGSALDYAHERGVIHRDLKPANVLLDERGDAHLTDFGIAKMLSENTVLTQSGIAIGTPAYMSPEQWLGQPVDNRADIYALGVMLYEMLSGALPFNADTPFGMMHKHVYDPPPPIREWRPDLPPGVDEVLQEALSKEREKRFQTTEAMVQAFKAAIGAKATPAQLVLGSPDPTPRSTLSRIRTRHWGRTDVLSLGMAITVLIALALVILGLSKRGQSPEVAAQAPTHTPQGVLMLPTATPSATAALTLTPTNTDTLPPTNTPTIKHTLDFRATAVVAVRETATAKARASFTPAPSSTPDIYALALATIHAGTTLTATNLPATSTLDLPATLSAVQTAILALTHDKEESATAIVVASFTHTALPTATSTVTQTPTAIPTATNLPTASSIATPGSMPLEPQTSLLVSTHTATPMLIPSAANLPAVNSIVTPSPTLTAPATSALDAVAVAMVPQAAIISAANADQVIEWDVAQQGSRLIDAIAFSPDGKLLASGGEDRNILLSDVQTGQLLKTLSGHAAPVPGVAFSPDGTLLASASLDSTVRLWEIPDGKQRIVLREHKTGVHSVTFSPDGKLLASAGEDRYILLSNVQTGAQQAVLQGHTATVIALVFSPDGSLLASAGGDRVVRLWNVQTGLQQAVLQGHTATVTALAFSPDGQLLASAGGDGVVRLWNVQTGVQQALFQGHTDSMNSVAFNADGTLLASGAADMTIRLWDVQKAAPKAVLQGHTGVVSSVVFNTASTLLASGSYDGTLRLWGRKDTLVAPDRCTISSEGGKKVAIRVGPGKNRGVLSYMAANQFYPVIGQAAAGDGQPWWQLKTDDGSQAWVIQAEVKTSGNCGQMALAATPRVQLPPKPTITRTPLPPPPPSGGGAPSSGGGNQPPPNTSVPPTGVSPTAVPPTVETCVREGNLCGTDTICCNGLTCQRACTESTSCPFICK
jgi:tRNA A-37 threonylcarbamoyl transferase component Bud32/glucose/arabinose dehydrogenase